MGAGLSAADTRKSEATVDEDRQVDLLQPTVHHAPAVAATTCRSQWRRDARVLGPANTLCSDAMHALSTIPPSCGSKEAVSLGCQPGSSESAPFLWSVLGSPPSCTVRHCLVAGGH